MPTALHVESSGDGAPVILLHSSGLSGRQWRRLVPAITSRGLRAIVPDLTGHGASPPRLEPAPFSYREDVAWLVAHLAEVGPAHLVGHSYGALVALLAAQAAPRSVRSLVLFEPVAFGSLDPVADADARAELARVEVPWGDTQAAADRWLQAFVDYWGGEGAWVALREEARAEFRRVGWVVHEGVRTLVQDATPAASYRVIEAPLRLLTGERSPVAARRVVQRLGETIPSTSAVTLAGAGHMAPLTHPDVVNAAVIEALAPRG